MKKQRNETGTDILNVNKREKQEADMEANKQKAKYQRILTKVQETKNSARNSNVPLEDEKEEEPRTKGILINNRRENQAALEEIQLDNLNDEEDVGFNGLGLRKYLEQKEVISVERPDFQADKMGKRSKLEYAKDLAYFHQELNKLGGEKVMKESEQRMVRKRIDEMVHEEMRKEIEGEGEGEVELQMPPEDSFERKKSNMRELMCKPNENVLLPPLQRTGVRNGYGAPVYGETTAVERKMPKNVQVKEHFIVPPQYRTQVTGGSNDTTKHSSEHKINQSDESDAYGLNSRPQSKFKKSKKGEKYEVLTQESEEEAKQELKDKRGKPVTFKKYREIQKENKKKKKKLARQRQKEIIERKNSSNGSIKRNTSQNSMEEIEEVKERKERTHKLIDRIIKVNEKKEQEKQKWKKDIQESKLEVRNVPLKSPERKYRQELNDSHRSGEAQRLVSPKPPKPQRKGDSNSNIMSQSNNSMNVSQLLRETQPKNKHNYQKRTPETQEKEKAKKIKIVPKEKVRKININKIKMKNAPVLNLKNQKQPLNLVPEPKKKDSRLDAPHIEIARFSDEMKQHESNSPEHNSRYQGAQKVNVGGRQNVYADKIPPSKLAQSPSPQKTGQNDKRNVYEERHQNYVPKVDQTNSSIKSGDDSFSVIQKIKQRKKNRNYYQDNWD